MRSATLDDAFVAVAPIVEDVRARASYIFLKHGTPEDYPRLLNAFIGCSKYP